MIKKYKIDELSVGQKFEFKKKISKSDIEMFSNATNDYHPLHTDIKYSKSNGFKDIIAQGFLLVSHVSYVIGMELPGENAIILSQESKFLKPVFAEEELLYSCLIDSIDHRFSVITVSYKIFNSSLVSCVVGTVKVKIRSNLKIEL